jgi:hypothetical protein
MQVFDAYVVLSREWDELGEERVDVFSTYDKARAFVDKLIAIAYKDYRVIDDGTKVLVFEAEGVEIIRDEDLEDCYDWRYMVEILPTHMDILG